VKFAKKERKYLRTNDAKDSMIGYSLIWWRDSVESKWNFEHMLLGHSLLIIFHVWNL